MLPQDDNALVPAKERPLDRCKAYSLTWLAQPACRSCTMQHPARRAESCGRAFPVMALLRPHGPCGVIVMAAKQRRGSSQQRELGSKGSLLSSSSGQGLKGAGGEVKVTRQGREETTKTRNHFPREKAEGNVFSNARFICLISTHLMAQLVPLGPLEQGQPSGSTLSYLSPMPGQYL